MTESTKREFLNILDQLEEISPQAKTIVKNNITDQTPVENMCFFLARTFENHPKRLTPRNIRLLNAFNDYIELKSAPENRPLKKN